MSTIGGCRGFIIIAVLEDAAGLVLGIFETFWTIKLCFLAFLATSARLNSLQKYFLLWKRFLGLKQVEYGIFLDFFFSILDSQFGLQTFTGYKTRNKGLLSF